MSIKKAKEVVAIQADAVKKLGSRLDGEFTKAIDILFKCKGRVVVCGMGKTGIVARKISATLSSTGTPSLYLHSAEAVHGDLGQVQKADVIILISYSGETDETKRLIPLIKKIGTKIISMTGNKKSTLAKYSNVHLDVSVKKEGCPLNLAPMASTTATLVMGDAVAACLIERKRFKREDFAFYHPGGSLGRKLLLRVEDVMRKGSNMATVKQNVKIRNVLLQITKARCGCACIVDEKGKFVGIFTDGDLRRHLDAKQDILDKAVKEVMTRKPQTITQDQLAVDAFEILKERKIDELPVVNKTNKLVGLLDIQDLLKAGLM